MQAIAVGLWIAAIALVVWARGRVPIVIARGSGRPLAVMAVVFVALLALIGPDKTHFWFVLALPPVAVLAAGLVVRTKYRRHREFWKLLHEGRLDEARALVEPDVAKRPSAAAYNQLGLVHYQSEAWDEAVEAFGKALAEPQGDTPVVRANLGLARYKRGERDEGLAILEAARDAMPGELSTRLNLAILYAETGRRDEARKELAAGEEIARRPIAHDEVVVSKLLAKAREAVSGDGA